MSERSLFLTDKVVQGDAVLIDVLAKPQAQVLRARVLRIYATRKCLHGQHFGDEIEFVHASSTWGNVALQVGERGIVFLMPIRERLYEVPSRGHMVVEDIGGRPHAIFPHLFISTDPASPSSRSIQDPKRSYARAIALDELEAYLLGLIAGNGVR